MRMSALRQYNTRVIVSGNVVEKYVYENPVARGFARRRQGGRARALFTSQEIKDDNRKKVASRARARVRRMANANPQLNKFLTLTYAENKTDISACRYDFDKFVKRMKTRYSDFQYICVIEFQKRGAVHFHLLCNLPYVNVNELAMNVWKQGFIKLNRIDNVDNVGAYVTKYMTKEDMDDRLIGKKCYTMSKGLNEPVTLTDEEEIELLEESLEGVKRIHSAEFVSDYYGTITYTQVVCSAPVPVKRKRKGLFDSLARFLHGKTLSAVFPGLGIGKPVQMRI